MFMKNKEYLWKKSTVMIAGLLLCFGMTVTAAPSVEGSTELTAVTGEIVSAEYTITNDEDMDAAAITVSYDKDVLTYMSGSGGNNFSGNGGNGSVQLSSKPGDTTAVFSIKFKGKSDEDTSLSVTSCVVTVNGKEIDVLSGGTSQEGAAENTDEKDEESEEEEEGEERASFVIDERTFYVRRPDDLAGFDVTHLDIQGIDSRVLNVLSGIAQSAHKFSNDISMW